MTPSAERALGQEGFLYVQQRSANTRYNISTRWNPRAQRSPFHFNCTLPVSSQVAFRVPAAVHG